MAKSPLRWRPNCIRFWRDYRKMTLEEASAALEQEPYRLRRTHNSLGRVENGKQMPSIALIEALAKLYRTDVDSLLNRKPEEASPTANGLLQLWDRAGPEERQLILGVAKRVAQ